MALFAAVRAEHTVSETTEEPLIFLNSNTSSHFKETSQHLHHITLQDPEACYNKWLIYFNIPLLSHPQTLYSFLNHIHNYDYTPLNFYKFALKISIKLDYSECYIHLPHESETLSDHFTPQLSGYEYYPSIIIPSKYSPVNNKIQITKLIIEDNALDYTYVQLVEAALSNNDDDTFVATQHFASIQPHTCYNKFLFYNHLPLLSHPQTIISFLRYINNLGYLPSNACDYTLTISIKNDYSEAHVYLPFESKPLKNHFIPPLQCIWHFPNILLKSDTTTEHNLLNLTNLSNTSLPLYSSPSILQTPLIQPSHSPTSAPSPSIFRPCTNYFSDFSLNLNLATYNIQGFNNPEKKFLMEKYCLQNNLHIISLTETKIAETKNKKFYNNHQFSYYWSNCSTSKEGTCIMIKNNLQPHIHNILNHPGEAIAIDLFFKHDYKFRIISTYLSSTNNSVHQQTQSSVIT